MIAANELRIGNYLQLENGKLCQIKQLGFAPEIKISKGCTVNDYTYKELFPTIVTSEILEKCGAKPFPSGDLILNGYLIGWAECRSTFIHMQTSVELKSLHQLQNLYFALTGTELKINL